MKAITSEQFTRIAKGNKYLVTEKTGKTRKRAEAGRQWFNNAISRFDSLRDIANMSQHKINGLTPAISFDGVIKPDATFWNAVQCCAFATSARNHLSDIENIASDHFDRDEFFHELGRIIRKAGLTEDELASIHKDAEIAIAARLEYRAKKIAARKARKAAKQL